MCVDLPSLFGAVCCCTHPFIRVTQMGPMIPGAHVGPIWKTGALPVPDNNEE